MTIASTTSRADYVGSDITGPYAYGFRVFAATDLEVTVRLAAYSIETTLNYPADYTVSGVGNRSGGSITLTSALAAGDSLTIRRVRPMTQATSLRNQGPYFPESIEDALDHTVMLIQQQDDVIGRGVSLPVTVSPEDVSAELPVPDPSKVLIWNPSGTALTNSAIDTDAIAVPGEGRTTATATEYLAKNAEFNVRDYGAVGNGVTDDSAAIAATFAAAGDNAKIVFAQNAIYGIGATAVLLSGKTGVTMVGNGSTLKMLAQPATDATYVRKTFVRLHQCENVTVDGFNLDANGFGACMIGLSACVGCRVTNNRIDAIGLAQTGIIALFGGGNGNRVVGNEIFGTTVSTPCIWAGNYTPANGGTELDVLIHQNYIHDVQSDGIMASAVSGTISGNVIKNIADGSAIAYGGYSGDYSHGLAISGNVISNMITRHGIQCDVLYATDADRARNVTITGNSIRNCGSAVSAMSGIYLVNADTHTITGNICVDCGASGIEVGRTSRSTIVGNICRDSRSGGARTQQNGIRVLANDGWNCNDMIITNNECSNNVLNGVFVVVSDTIGTIDRVVVSNNLCHDNTTGISVIESGPDLVTGIVVTGNVSRGNSLYDIRVGPLDAVIADNIYTTELDTQYLSWVTPDTTPSVLGGRQCFRAAFSAPTSVTTFDDGVNGREFEVYVYTANVTFVDGTLIMQGARDYTPPANAFLRFRRLGANWIESYRSTPMVQAAALADIGALTTTQTAGGAYTATEQAMLNAIKADLAAIRTSQNTELANQRTAEVQA